MLATFLIVMSLASHSAEAENPQYVSDCPAGYVQEAVSLVNFLREKRGLGMLYADVSLMQSTRSRAFQMAVSKNLTHSGWKDSIVKVGYSVYSAIGENIARGYPSPTSVVTGWYNSPGHRENLMDPDFQYMGIGCAVAKDGSLWWSQHFAAQN